MIDSSNNSQVLPVNKVMIDLSEQPNHHQILEGIHVSLPISEYSESFLAIYL